MLKKYTGILLLMVFSYSFIGAGFVYNLWLYNIKKEVKEGLKATFGEEEAVVIKVPASWEEDPPENFEWHEEHEFRYRGQMYDIIRKEYHGDQVWYYSYWDKAETELLNNLSEYVSVYLMQEPDRQKKESTFKLFLTKIFLLPQYLMNFELLPGLEKISFTLYQFPTVCLDIDLPPPKSLFSI